MITIQTILTDLEVIQASRTAGFVQVLEHGRQVLKARVYLSGELFVQVYRNDRFGTTSFALILGGRRIYGRDEREGQWHRHQADAPDAHDESKEGRRAVELHEFWAEVLAVLVKLGLLL